VFALALWLLVTGRESFSEPIGYIGALIIPLALLRRLTRIWRRRI
jgi:hypothetical protein